MSAGPGGAAPAVAGPAYGPWADPDRRSAAATFGLVAVAWLLVVDVLWTLVGIATVGDLVAAPSDAWFDHYDLITMIVGWVYLAVLVLSAATFIRWQRAAIRNLRFLGCEKPEIGPGLAAFGWFIPLANLVLPLLSMREIARWSRPRGAASAGGLLGWWWGTWLIPGFLVSIASFVFQIDSETTTWIIAAALDAVGTLGIVASSVVTIKMVRTLSRWQHRSRTDRAATRPE